jgi:hypothetical protein
MASECLELKFGMRMRTEAHEVVLTQVYCLTFDDSDRASRSAVTVRGFYLVYIYFL